MDNAYRFGSVEVTCEGYSYPEDPYVLKGSCGVSNELVYFEKQTLNIQVHPCPFCLGFKFCFNPHPATK